jgi:hypothetical protein
LSQEAALEATTVPTTLVKVAVALVAIERRLARPAVAHQLKRRSPSQQESVTPSPSAAVEQQERAQLPQPAEQTPRFQVSLRQAVAVAAAGEQQRITHLKQAVQEEAAGMATRPEPLGQPTKVTPEAPTKHPTPTTQVQAAVAQELWE